MSTPQLPEKEVDRVIDLALDEDVSHGDVTSQALLPPDLSGRASFLVKERGVLAGIGVAGRVFQRVDPSLKIDILIQDGTPINPGDIAGTVAGRVTSILKAERVSLNFLQRLSGVASLTAQYVAAVKGLPARIVDTRKTTPGLRRLEKYAVRMGGGHNHRTHLGDAVLIKDNHIAALRATGLTLREIVARARENAPPGITVEVEITRPAEAREALEAGADTIMLDNMGPADMRQVVETVNGQARLEASGGITLANVREVAETGVDIISIGALTHSYRALDISLELETPEMKLL
ncbi:MAG: nicotinate-nucleotide diphosphorylase (carboxylating) [Chloroflexi bacterium RBG_16_60_22]|nr:MAG: nicotinate-nucleotide diphosphorylase (carboxylating) [Chloroflexi bacterium RBG_16_60_22]